MKGKLAMAVAGSSSLIVPEPKEDAIFELNVLDFGFAFAHRPSQWPVFFCQSSIVRVSGCQVGLTVL